MCIKFILNKDGDYTYIDHEDLNKILNYHWVSRNGNDTPYYVDKGRKSILMSRFLLNAPKYKWVDHINGNRIDNRKENLRLCSRNENAKNRKLNKSNNTGYKGVSKSRNKYKKWKTIIGVNNKKLTIGTYSSIIDAAIAYNIAAEKYHGNFARLNVIYFPPFKSNDDVNYDIIYQRPKIISTLNTSGYRGVSLSNDGHNWQSKIKYQDKDVFIGRSTNIKIAALMYDIIALRYYGNDAKTNFSIEEIEKQKPFIKIPMDDPKNISNKSGFTGVHKERNGKWRSVIEINKKKINLGIYDDPIVAAKMYDRALIHYNKTIYPLNFPNEIDWELDLERYISAKPKLQRSKYHGITFIANKNRWRVSFSMNGKKTHYGTYKYEILAALIYDEKIELHKNPRSKINFPAYLSNTKIDPNIIFTSLLFLST